MAQMIRNDSASAMSSLQMDYGDSDEDELSRSRNNSIDTKDANLKEQDMDIVHDDDDQKTIANIDIKPEVVEAGSSHETNRLIKSENTDNVSKSLFGNFSTDLKTETIPFSQKVQINAAPDIGNVKSLNESLKEPSTGTPLDEVISDEEDLYRDEEDKVSALSEGVNQESPASLPSQPSTNLQKKPIGLVSYGADEDFDDSASDSDSDVEVKVESHENSPALSDPSALSRSVQNMSGDDIKIPPEPPGNCSRLLQNKIEDMFQRMRNEGLDLNRVIQRKKMFRNPSIYEKLIDYCNIDQKGTNFPPEIYDPHIWGKESYYDELDRAQRKEMEKRQKEKNDKTKVEFVVGTKKSSAEGSSYPDEKKRKTKWDTQPSGVVKAHGVQGPGVVNLTATATGTKATVISAVGSLSKKSSK